MMNCAGRRHDYHTNEPSKFPNGAGKMPSIGTAKALKDEVFPPIKFIVKGYVVEGATILAGRPKIGKSWLALDWGIAVARGGVCFGDVRCKEGDVLYIALEDNNRRLKSRLANPHYAAL